MILGRASASQPSRHAARKQERNTPVGTADIEMCRHYAKRWYDIELSREMRQHLAIAGQPHSLRADAASQSPRLLQKTPAQPDS
jgi:hypothetical protein